MANPIDIIITQEALKVVDTAIAKVNLLDKTMQETAQHFIDNAKKMASVTPSGVSGSAENNAAVTAQLKSQADTIAKLSAELVNLNEKLTKLNATKATGNKLTADEIVKNQAERRAAIELAKANSDLIGSYDKLNIQHQKALRNAQNLGATYGSTSKQFKEASAAANILDKELKDIDATLGRSQRNVGNYGKSFNSLGSTLGQLGVITGVGGIIALGQNAFTTSKELQSLNLALLAVTGTQEEFAKQQLFLTGVADKYGLQIEGLTEQFTSFYVSAKGKLDGKEIQEVFENISKSGSALGLSNDTLKRSFAALNQMLSKGKVASEELRGQLAEALPGAVQAMTRAVQKLHPEIKNLTEAGLFEMIKAGKILAEEVLPETSRQLLILTGADKATGVETLTKLTNRLTNSWAKMIQSINESDSSGFASFVKSIVAGLTNILDFTGLLFKDEKQLQNYFKNIGQAKGLEQYQAILQNISATTKEQQEATKKELLFRERENIRVNQAIIKAEKEKRESITGGDRALFHLQTKAEEDALVQLGKSAAIIKAIKEESIVTNKKVVKSVEEVTKEEEKRAKIEKFQAETVGTTIQQIDKYIDLLRTEMILNAGNTKETEKLTKALTEAEEAREAMFGTPTADVKIINNIKKTTAAVKELSEETKQFLKTFVDEFASNSGFSSLISSFDLDNPNSLFSKIKEGIAFTKENWQASTVEIAEAGQEMYNFITNASQANFEAEKERLQAQYDVSLKYAGDNKAAQEKLAEDLEKKKKEIDQREAKAKKEQAIFNIAIDTAQAIVASLPNLVLAGIVAALGAIQIAAVASQKIPQFWMGGTHEGGLMMVNDGGGSNYKETVVTPDGKIMKPQGKNVIMNAPAGTEIYTNSQWNEKLAEMLQGKGIDMAPVINNNSGLSKSDMYDVMMDAFGSQPQHVSNFDAQGATEYITRNGNKTILNRNRSNGKGQRFR